MILTKYPIKDVCDGIFDGPHATPKESDSGFVFLGIRNITEDGRLDFTDNRLISEDEYPKWTKRVVPTKDDIVFSYEATLHRYAILPEGFKGCLGRRMALVRVNKEIVYPKYMYFYFLSPKWRAMIEANIIVGSTVDRISILKFPNFEVQLPDLKTQIFIADTLSHYDDLIQTNQQRIALLEEAAQRLYDEWFVKLRFPNYQQVPVVGGVPEGWEKGSIYDFADILSGGTPNTTEPAYWKGDIPFFTPKDSPDSFFAFSCEKNITKIGLKSCNSRLYLEGSIFITARGTVGKICFAGVPMAMNQSCYSVKPKEDVSTYYFYLALQKSVAQIKQTANGGVFDAIIVDTFKSIDMLRPSKPITDFFHKKTEPLFEQMKNLITQNQKLTQARDELLPRLMSGQLNVIL